METEKTNSQYALDIINGMHERTERRLWQIIIALIVVILLMAGVFIWYISQYEFTAFSTEYTQDGAGLNIIGERNGAYVNGAKVQNNESLQNPEE